MFCQNDRWVIRKDSDESQGKGTHSSLVPDEPVYIPARQDAHVVAPAIQMDIFLHAMYFQTIVNRDL